MVVGRAMAAAMAVVATPKATVAVAMVVAVAVAVAVVMAVAVAVAAAVAAAVAVVILTPLRLQQPGRGPFSYQKALFLSRVFCPYSARYSAFFTKYSILSTRMKCIEYL